MVDVKLYLTYALTQRASAGCGAHRVLPNLVRNLQEGRRETLGPVGEKTKPPRGSGGRFLDTVRQQSTATSAAGERGDGGVKRKHMGKERGGGGGGGGSLT
ncbi:hypothetical protein EYF80_017654 [Liparis tanakae]|uniref:Uncharacterized protein n=1 Tax=Liparis tanakae TaxID=230148 RepID=A0A4Z2I254_9TELE|nr:hypothetical protein EYF80_017654 [Liparis tanakae]